MPLLTLLVNCDTRKGTFADATQVGDFPSEDLKGCRNSDFLYDGIVCKQRFIGDYDVETIVVVDEHEPLPPDLKAKIESLPNTSVVVTQFERTSHRWNDRAYNFSMGLGDSKFIVHFDQDVAAFRRPEYDAVAQYLKWLERYRYICQQHIGGDWMYHASTRFFICERATIDLKESERLIEDAYRAKRFPGKHMPCYEFILAEQAGPDAVLYPTPDFENYLVFSWSRYHSGILNKLNEMPYSEVANYVLKTCGLHGASDCIAKPME